MIGNYIILNVFLAILIKNFDDTHQDLEEEDDDDDESQSRRPCKYGGCPSLAVQSSLCQCV